jgi:hypothetical protein
MCFAFVLSTDNVVTKQRDIFVSIPYLSGRWPQTAGRSLPLTEHNNLLNIFSGLEAHQLMQIYLQMQVYL